MRKGKIVRVNGPLVVGLLENSRLNEVVYVGEEKLVGEVIKVVGNKVFIQVYEETSGLSPGDVIYGTNRLFEAELGPGLLANIFDGLQRPLNYLEDFIKRGFLLNPIDRKKKWEFIPVRKKNDSVKGGEVLGYVDENGIKHKILVPPNLNGKIDEIYEGEFTVEDTIAIINGKEIKLLQKWPIRFPRPFKEKLPYDEQLITKIRVIDYLFPIAKGGSAAVPGGFGTGKTTLLYTLAKTSRADIVIIVACGERGNEVADMIESFKELKDEFGKRMIDKSIIIANTSNMPVAARESSIFLGITLAEYYRDMGYNVILIADSISRWAEAIREISSRLEEIPGEEGYPAYMFRRLAEFYNRAGKVVTLSGEIGSITVCTSVSPPGDDLSEPVTQNVFRLVGSAWILSRSLSSKKHYPAIDYLQSYSLYVEELSENLEKTFGKEYRKIRDFMVEILRKEMELLEFVEVVGKENLPQEDQLILHIAKVIKEGFLKQNFSNFEDLNSIPEKTRKLAEIIYNYYILCRKLLEQGKKVRDIEDMKLWVEIIRLKEKSLDEILNFEKRMQKCM